MTIAGSDSGGGAGLQADLKTFTTLGVFGTVVVTGLTAQNTKGVFKVLEVPPDFVESQIDVIMTDLKPEYAKTGMLANSRIVEVVRKKVREYNIRLVLDPVMVAKSGDLLVTEDTVSALKELIRESIILTPNKFEAEKIVGRKIENILDLKNTAREIYTKYGVDVVVKGGGSLGGIDYAIVQGEEIELQSKKMETKNTHGSGDVFSASLTAYLAKGHKIKEAVKMAKEFVSKSIEYSLDLGEGNGPVDPFSNVESIVERETAREDAENLLWQLERNPKLIRTVLEEEDKSNVAVLTSYQDVATLAGGTIPYLDKIKVDGPVLINLNNKVTQIAKDYKRRIVLSVSLNSNLLNAVQEGTIKITKSGLDGDLILHEGRAYLTANTVEEMIEKLKRVSK
ncbi:hydroxymethylpyrimidine/phosphomethylpyrimidine kinase [Sulfolobus acidocaldarius]|nr:bifunctional hydroxymethylpyrimidine kinase/phosphomethylpyrimidine kinase [Sulfolobus acidocaldarius]AGE70248.1 phosphomethylpyrimidine kinase [Sulfolobus acidocaldarius N8]AGE72523.1 phosphomethylpyrimidine kinase [Sulfolobus acidocaldarius Ron12/I]ALU30571.1 hydroxymethylpyrimidine/phosphomethylpyrimidine kinase [Sulfolobus acidocaldarius]ALU32833.1 hydroxymethylpyrimidine/phosphomethylpyrimidine kinase [Sulfolobus acidocaldarius]WCM35983.1 bifunctional hydroxymethylpyrimidine kinase/pho